MFTVVFLKDMAERVIWTFAQAFAAGMIVETSWTPDALKVAGMAAALAVLKAIAASQIGNPKSAATLPAENAEADGGEGGQWYAGNAVGLFALIIVVLFVAWLMVKADILRIP